MKRLSHSTALALILLNGIVHPAEKGNAPFSIGNASQAGLDVLYAPTPKPFSTVLIDSISHVFFVGPSFDILSGSPNLPADALTIGIPLDAAVSAELVETRYVTETPSFVAPVPTYDVRDSSAIPTYRKNPTAYNLNALFPARQVEVGRPFMIRGQQVCRIRVAPVQYNPVTRVVRRLTYARLHISFRLPPARSQIAAGPRAPDTHYEKFFRSLLANYDQALMWREDPRPIIQNIQRDSSRAWFRTGQTYVQIPVSADGWYTLRKDALAASGVSPLQADWTSLAVYNRGVQIPFRLAADSSIFFYARQNYGDSTYVDYYTDTNVYWLTWGEPSARRFNPGPQVPGTPDRLNVSVPVTQHVEQNTQFFVGTTIVDVGSNAPIPGRGWLWEYYYPGTTVSHPFSIDSIDAGAYPTATVQVRLFSTTLNYAADGRNHKAKFWVNDSLIGQVYFAGRSGTTFSADIPATWLKNGNNLLRITSDTSSSQPNQFYLDWFEISYGRFLKARSDQLTFAASPPFGGILSFAVSGFSRPTISVYDLTLGRQLQGGTVTGSPASGYRMVFQDTCTSARTYLVAVDSAAVPISQLSRKAFRDIRSNAAGADYIVITHAAFLAQAQQLASYRQAFNGVRTAVIDVQDIYDEFNFGIMNAERLRNFLRYAYDFWPGTKPSYLLLFGDASWDFHHYLPTTIKTNYVPAYGVPAGDNWFVVFNADSSIVPSMFVGRLPVQSQTDAQAVVAKAVLHDSYTLGDWNKTLLYITAGDDISEQTSFNALCESSISTYVNPPPIGGTAARVYKTGPAVIDGGYKQYLKDLVRQGLSLISYIGHSGGRIWGVDIGPPSDLENTDGKLPFVSSVSCNVGAFAEPSNNVLAEDFVLAPNRGAIAVWASAALGYPYQGAQLVDFFLDGVQKDSLRDFGSLTTLARLRLWQQSPSFISQADLSTTPLLGDPLSRLAIPLKPDLALSSEDIILNRAAPTLLDTALTLRVNVHNFGLVPADSVVVSLTDQYNGRISTIRSSLRIGPTRHRDSLFVPWAAASQPGKHTITVVVDPAGTLPEVSKTNNIASTDIYIFASELVALKPLRDQVVPAQPQTLITTTPLGNDSTGYQYAFELDTVSSFDSPFKVGSGPIASGPVSGQWTTPTLAPDRVYFWRARTANSQSIGQWVVSQFRTAGVLPVPPLVRLQESSRAQFAQNDLVRALPTDSGVVIAPRPPLFLYARSLGYRADLNKDYYSIIRLNEVTVTGYWWHLGNSFMVMRVNDFTGEFQFTAFDVASQASLSDSMRQFLRNTPRGNYIAVSVIFDGATNVSESLRVALESLGSTSIRSVLPGQAWAFIARQGYPTESLESLTNDSAVVSLQIPNFFSAGAGSVTALPTPMPSLWHTLHWEVTKSAGKTDVALAVLGVRRSGTVDTLRRISSDSTDVDLRGLSGVTSDTSYASFRLSASLATSDALFTPALKRWHVDLEPPGDLAISGRTVGVPQLNVRKGKDFDLPVTVHNLGYREIDSVRILVSIYDTRRALLPFGQGILDSLPAGSSKSVSLQLPSSYLSGTVSALVTVSPAHNDRELTAVNNSAGYSFTVSGDQGPQLQFFSDGIRLMDGDYVATNPTIRVKLPAQSGPPPAPPTILFYVDNVLLSKPPASTGLLAHTGDDPTFSPVLQDGRHEFRITVAQPNMLGGIDSLQNRITVNVLGQARILQVFNYPNPFARETLFTFVLTGSAVPDEVSIRIFTVAGRKIREISVLQGALQIGFNQVRWDGRDADGDEIANGTYLYQVRLKSPTADVSEISKLVRLR